MVVDDEIVIKLIDKLHTSMQKSVNAERLLDTLINNLLTIRRNEDDSLPIDILTGLPITEERRTDILESTINDSAQFVGGE